MENQKFVYVLMDNRSRVVNEFIFAERMEQVKLGTTSDHPVSVIESEATATALAKSTGHKPKKFACKKLCGKAMAMMSALTPADE